MKIAMAMVSLLMLVLASPLAAADTRYVSDRLIVTVRAGTAPGSEVLASVLTDEPLEVLEDGDTFMKVRTREGVVGFIQAQYVTRETPKAVIIERQQKEIDRLQKRIAELQQAQSPQAQETESLRRRAQSLEKELAETRGELESLTVTHNRLVENSGHVVELTAEQDRLREENRRLSERLDGIEEENAQLLRQGMIHWFLAGAGVLLMGWILGKMSRKKRRF